ncbi:hypothetical protein [Erythrobacter sp.]|uniref:hypothetical protein n=1 Tax=Erythrobacter sp. TaxID=1042 RepID=UPI0025C5253C|nr:hypothetical protein [Erythrobacter sp.]
MIEADSNVDALIGQLARYAGRLRTIRTTHSYDAADSPKPDWRSAAHLWPGFAQD